MWEDIRPDRRKLRADAEAGVVRFGAGQSPYYVSAVRVCLVYRLHGRQQRRRVVLSDIRNESGEVLEFNWLTHCLALCRSVSLSHAHIHIHIHNDTVTEVSAGLSLLSCLLLFPGAVVPASCCGRAVPRKIKKACWQYRNRTALVHPLMHFDR